MKTVAFLFAVAVCTSANPVEKRSVANDEIEKLLDDFIKISNEKTAPNLTPGDDKMELESNNVKLMVTFLDNAVYGIGKLSMGPRSVDQQKNTLEIVAPLEWFGTKMEGDALVEGTVNGKNIKENMQLKIIAGKIHNKNRFKFSFDENSVTLDEFDIGEVHFDDSVVKTNLQKSGTVTAEELEKAIKESFKEYLMKILSEIIKNAKSFITQSEAKLKTKNLAQHVNAIKKEFHKILE